MPETTVQRLRARARRTPNAPALTLLESGGATRDVTLTWGDWAARVERLALALVDEGLRRGERVAVFAGNDLLWPVADLAILSAGGVSVGVYATSTTEQLLHTLADCEARTVFVDTRERCERLREVRDRLPLLRTVVCAEGPAEGAEALGTWLATRGAAGTHRVELESRVAALSPDDPAVVVYTSGSTGVPKGAVLSHRYVTASADSIAETLGLTADDTTLSFLPFAHASERIFGLHTRIATGVAAGLVPDARRIWEAAVDFRPTSFGGIPRIYEKAAERIAATREEGDAAAWDRALQLGRQRSRIRRSGADVPEWLEAEWRAAGTPLFEAAARVFGDRLRVASSGGAALPLEAAELLDAAGVTVLGAYGLTEHLCVAFNRPGRHTFDTAGPPMPGTQVRIASDGEILVRRSALTFSGYLGRPEATAAAFTADGEWLRTGDLGELDPKGRLRVTGRKKELIALSTGRKVAPGPIEAKLATHPRVAQAVVCGEGRKFLTALLFLRGNGDADAGDGPLCADGATLAELDAAVAEANRGRPRFEQVGRYVAIDRELSEAAGELTDTHKVRRGTVEERFRDRIEALYREGEAR